MPAGPHHRFVSVNLAAAALLSLLAGLPSPARADDLDRAYSAYERAVKLGQYERARESARKCLEIADATIGKDALKTGVLAYNYGVMLLQVEETEEAIEPLNRALAVSEKHRGVLDVANVSIHRRLGSAHQTLEQWKPAERHYVRAVDILGRNRGKDDEEIADVLLQAGMAATALQKFSRSKTYARRAHAIYAAKHGEDSVQVAGAYRAMALNDINSGRYRDGRNNLDKAAAIFESKYTEGDPQLVEFYRFAEETYAAAGSESSSRKYRRKRREAEEARAALGF